MSDFTNISIHPETGLTPPSRAHSFDPPPKSDPLQWTPPFLLALHEDTGLLMTEPREFRADRFSKGSGTIHQVSLGDTGKLREAIGKYQTFEWDLDQ